MTEPELQAIEDRARRGESSREDVEALAAEVRRLRSAWNQHVRARLPQRDDKPGRGAGSR